MGRRLVLIGCIGAVFLLMLTTFSSAVCSQKVQLNEKQVNSFQQIKTKIENNDWAPGGIIDTLGFIILVLLVFITEYLRYGGPPPG
ncbi:MAG: hypothetical protein NT038_04760 [Euryarchaeota archaeon]|nr:hypothetical protein [Euryarchaeota archaeon]